MSRFASRRVLGLLMTAGLAAAIAFPVGVIASHFFADVPDSNPYHNDIDALADAGVTTGCGGGNYCPSDVVTREQMAAFMNRLGALAPGKTPVVNATKLDGLDSTDFLQVDDTVISQFGPVFGGEFYTPAITYHFDRIRVASDTDGYVMIPLTKPEVISGQSYGLLSVDICHLASANLSIDDTTVFYVTTAGYAGVLGDSTDRSTAQAGCYSLTGIGPVSYNGPYMMSLYLNFSASSELKLVEVTTHWTPV